MAQCLHIVSAKAVVSHTHVPRGVRKSRAFLHRGPGPDLSTWDDLRDMSDRKGGGQESELRCGLWEFWKPGVRGSPRQEPTTPGLRLVPEAEPEVLSHHVHLPSGCEPPKGRDSPNISWQRWSLLLSLGLGLGTDLMRFPGTRSSPGTAEQPRRKEAG